MNDCRALLVIVLAIGLVAGGEAEVRAAGHTFVSEAASKLSPVKPVKITWDGTYVPNVLAGDPVPGHTGLYWGNQYAYPLTIVGSDSKEFDGGAAVEVFPPPVNGKPSWTVYKTGWLPNGTGVGDTFPAGGTFSDGIRFFTHHEATYNATIHLGSFTQDWQCLYKGVNVPLSTVHFVDQYEGSSSRAVLKP